MLSGSCHCGAVRFEIDWEIDEITSCDCSLCTIRNARMAKVPETRLRLVEGEDHLALYEWNTRRAKHHFCRRCGIYVFHRKRAAPDHYGVNVFCLHGFDPASVPLRATEGASMTIEIEDAREEWPGRGGRKARLKVADSSNSGEQQIERIPDLRLMLDQTSQPRPAGSSSFADRGRRGH